jgi:hypothetical protein
VPLIKQHHRDGPTHSEGNSKVDPFVISDNFNHGINNIQFYFSNRRHWSFAFAHASTSSKCILFAIRNLFQLKPFFKYPGFPWTTEWIVSEMIDWLKVRDFALIKDIFGNPDIWEEPNSGSSTTGSADRLDGRCKQESRRGDGDSEAGGH